MQKEIEMDKSGTTKTVAILKPGNEIEIHKRLLNLINGHWLDSEPLITLSFCDILKIFAELEKPKQIFIFYDSHKESAYIFFCKNCNEFTRQDVRIHNFQEFMYNFKKKFPTDIIYVNGKYYESTT